MSQPKDTALSPNQHLENKLKDVLEPLVTDILKDNPIEPVT